MEDELNSEGENGDEDDEDDVHDIDHPNTSLLRWDSRSGSRPGPRDPGLKKPWIPGTDLGQGQISQIYSNRLKFFAVTRSSSTCHTRCFPQSFGRIFEEGKKSFSQSTLQGFPGVREMWDARESLFPAPNYNTPVKDLTYKDLLTSTFTLTSHERGIKTWCVPATYPECLLWQNVSV